MQVCRICLAMNTKLYNMEENNLKTLYEQIIGLCVIERDKDPKHLCWECAQRVKNYARLRDKALHSRDLMTEFLCQNSYILTHRLLEYVDRKQHNLISSLTHKIYVNHTDLHIQGTNSDMQMANEVKIQGFTIDPDMKVKDEIGEYDINDLDFNIHSRDSKSSRYISNKNKTVKLKQSHRKIKNKCKKEIPECFISDLDMFTHTSDTESSSDMLLSKYNITSEILDKPLSDIKVKKKRKEAVSLPKIDKRRKPVNLVISEEIFDITDLSHEEQLSEIMKRQDSSNYKQCEFKCEMCYKGFLDEDAYKGHMMRHTVQCGTYECPVCKVRFKKPNALRNHVTSHMQKFSCKQCAYVTTRRNAAKFHQQYHNGIRRQCPHCQMTFGKYSTYMSHLRIKHPTDCICALCGYCFVSDKGLALHKQLKHRLSDHEVPPDGPYCDQCEVRFASQEALDRHLKLSARHSEGLDTKDNAGKRSKESETEDKGRRKIVRNESAKKKKKLVHKSEGPIPCEQCDVELPDAVTYYRHFRRSHPGLTRTHYPAMNKKCMCEVCGKMFQSLALLQDHSFTHTDSKQFRCAECGKSFQRRYRLIAHRRLHGTSRANHVCSVCGKRFTTSGNLQRHMVSHTGVRAFKCEMCGKSFKHASEKRAHITYVHLKKPWPKRSRGKRRGDDGRQLKLPPTTSELDVVQPLWPSCSDVKVPDIDKPVYYNLKI